MHIKPTGLLATARQIGKTIAEDYPGADTKSLESLIHDRCCCWADNDPGARMPTEDLWRMWGDAVETTGDSAVGLTIGGRIKPAHFNGLAMACIVSCSLLELQQRLVKYFRVITTSDATLKVEPVGDTYVLDVSMGKNAHAQHDLTEPPAAAMDALFAANLQLCRTASHSWSQPIKPLLVEFRHEIASEYMAHYESVFGCEVLGGSDHDRITYRRDDLDKPLDGSNKTLAMLTDAHMDKYLESLEPPKTMHEVQRLIIMLLPTGLATAEEVSSRMNRSVSTLNRQLAREGASFKMIKESAQVGLGRQYLGDRAYSIVEIAELTGYSSQSSFSRAFRRAEGMSPREFRG